MSSTKIAAASSEQATGIDQVNRSVTKMDNMTQQNAALAEETSAASVAIGENAEELKELVPSSGSTEPHDHDRRLSQTRDGPWSVPKRLKPPQTQCRWVIGRIVRSGRCRTAATRQPAA